jgi:hypothetical protein
MPQSNVELGGELERFIADLLGGEVHPGSGNTPFVKLDVRQREILFSCKSTRGHAVTLTEATLSEARRAVHGPGGIGGDVLPGFACRTLGGDTFVVMDAEDFADLFSREDLQALPPDKVRQRRKDSKLPPLLRDHDE